MFICYWFFFDNLLNWNFLSLLFFFLSLNQKCLILNCSASSFVFDSIFFVNVKMHSKFDLSTFAQLQSMQPDAMAHKSSKQSSLRQGRAGRAAASSAKIRRAPNKENLTANIKLLFIRILELIWRPRGIKEEEMSLKKFSCAEK